MVRRDSQNEWRSKLSNQDGVWNVSQSVHDEVDWLTLFTTRNKNPKWRDQLKAGVDASTYYIRIGADVAQLPLLGEARAYGSYPFDGRIVWSSSAIAHHPPLLANDATTRDQALARVKRKIASIEESYQALIPLAELREARGLIRQMIDISSDTIKAIANLKRSKGRSLLKYVQERWLIYSFGISPMMADLQGLSASMWAYLTKGDARDRVQGTARKEWLDNRHGDSITGLGAFPIRYGSQARHVLSYRFAAGWKFNIRSSNDYTAARHFGISPPAIIPALWETLAFSWMADYFGTIGDWLEDVFVGSAGTSMYVVENRKYQYRSVATYELYPNGAEQYLTRHRRGICEFTYWQFERTPLAALPSRSLRFKTLDEIGLHSLTKLLNLIALVRAR